MKNIDYVESLVKTQIYSFFNYLKSKYDSFVAQEEVAQLFMNALGESGDAFSSHKIVLDGEDNDYKILAKHLVQAMCDVYLKYESSSNLKNKMVQLFTFITEV